MCILHYVYIRQLKKISTSNPGPEPFPGSALDYTINTGVTYLQGHWIPNDQSGHVMVIHTWNLCVMFHCYNFIMNNRNLLKVLQVKNYTSIY